MYMRTFPKYYKDKTLIVGVTSSAWLQELNVFKKKLLSNIIKEAGKGSVTNLRFVLDSDIGKFQSHLRKPKKYIIEEPDLSTLPENITDAADKIDDKDLGDAIKKAAAANLKNHK